MLLPQTQIDKANAFHALHQQSEILILPNAWDVLSAKIFESVGAKAIATTSAGIAAVFGYPDGEKLPRDVLFTMIERIVQSVNVPVSVDIEAGYGETVEEVCDTVEQLLKLGIVGINLEDANPRYSGELFSIPAQTEKISAISQLAKNYQFPLFINARTDTFWLNLYSEEERLMETLKRLSAYQAAGASGIFIPGLTDAYIIKQVANKTHLPINLLAGSWIKNIAILKELGVARLSIGSAGIREVAAFIQKMAYQLVNEQKIDHFNTAMAYDMLQNFLLNASIKNSKLTKVGFMDEYFQVKPHLDEEDYEEGASELLAKTKSMVEVMLKCFDDTKDSKYLVPAVTLFNALQIVDDLLKGTIALYKRARVESDNEELDDEEVNDN